MTSDRIELFLTLTLYALPGLVVGFVVHELAHAAVAVMLGDPSPRNDGRLTLDPVEHIDPLGLALLLGIGFGFAKPVRFNPLRLRTRGQQALVAVAGPLANVLLAVLLGITLRVLTAVAPGVTTPSGGDGTLSSISLGHGGPGFILYFVLYQALVVNALLFVFNIIPIPPLDGFIVLRGLLGGVLPGVVSWMERNAGLLSAVGLMALFVLPATGHGPAGAIGDAADGVATRIFNGDSPAYVSGDFLYFAHGIYPFINVLRS